MEVSLIDEILSICKVLNKHKVQYLIVGGTAVAFHGYFRWSKNAAGTLTEKFDLDFWYNPTYDNYYNLLNSLAELGQDVKAFLEETTPNPQRSYFKFESNKFTLDFLPKLKGEKKFRQAYQNKVIVTFKGIDMIFIGFDDLIQDKALNPRPKDLADIEHLRNIKKN